MGTYKSLKQIDRAYTYVKTDALFTKFEKKKIIWNKHGR